MKNKVLANVIINASFTVIFLYINNLALTLGFEETFISIAAIHGVITTIYNAIFVSCLALDAKKETKQLARQSAKSVSKNSAKKRK